MPFSPELIVDHAIARKYFNPGKMLKIQNLKNCRLVDLYYTVQTRYTIGNLRYEKYG